MLAEGKALMTEKLPFLPEKDKELLESKQKEERERSREKEEVGPESLKRKDPGPSAFKGNQSINK